MRTVIVLFLALVLANPGAHAQTEKIARAERLSQLLGLDQILKGAQMAGVESTKLQMKSMLLELEKTGIPASVIARIGDGAEQVVVKMAQAWDPKEAAKIYALGLVELLTDKGLAAAELYYQTTDGQNSYTAIFNSQARVLEYTTSKSNAVLQAEMGIFLQKVKDAAIKARRESRK